MKNINNVYYLCVNKCEIMEVAVIIWDLNIALDHIKRYFGFLFEEESKILDSEFPDHFNNFVIIFERTEFRIRFTRDRLTIRMEIGTHQAVLGWSSDGWYDLISIVMYLTQKQIMISEYSETFDSDIQLERLAKVFRYFYDQIVELYKPENFVKQKEVLTQVNHETFLIMAEPERKFDRKKLKEQARLFWQSLGVLMESNDRISNY